MNVLLYFAIHCMTNAIIALVKGCRSLKPKNKKD